MGRPKKITQEKKGIDDIVGKIMEDPSGIDKIQKSNGIDKTEATELKNSIQKFSNRNIDIYEKTYEELADVLNAYVEDSLNKGIVPNISGFSDWVKVGRTTLYRISNGEVKKASPELIDFVNHARSYFENIIATRMLSGQISRSSLGAYIFSLKATAGWNENIDIAISNSVDIKIKFSD